MLLEAGADPNDGQAIYNAGIGNARPDDDIDWLEALFERGFGNPSDGPWYRRFGDRLTEPATAREHIPDLIRVACELAKPVDTIRQLGELGWHVNAKNHTTALHEAAMLGTMEIVHALIALGADPSIIDDDHNATAAGWAEHFGHVDIRDHLEDRRRRPTSPRGNKNSSPELSPPRGKVEERALAQLRPRRGGSG